MGVRGINLVAGGEALNFGGENVRFEISDALLPQPTSSSSFFGFWFWKIHFLGKRVIQSHLASRMRYLEKTLYLMLRING